MVEKPLMLLGISGTMVSTTVSEARPHVRPRAAMQRGEVDDGGLGGEVRRLRRAAGRRAGPRRPARAAAGRHDRAAAARRAQGRGADGGKGRAGPGRGGPPVAAPLRRRGTYDLTLKPL